MSNNDVNKLVRVLVTTSTFPRWKNDSEPAFVYELSKRLSDSFDITVLAPRAPGSKKYEKFDNLNVIRFPYFFQRWENLATHGGGILNRLRTNKLNYLLLPFFFIGQFYATVKLLKKFRFNLIHAHWIIPQGLVAVISRFLASKTNQPSILVTSHGNDLFALRGKLFRFLKLYVINNSDSLTVVSNAMRNLVKGMGVRSSKIKVLPMGVDLKTLFKTVPVERSKNEIIFVGRFVEKKGLHILIEAMSKLQETYSDIILTVAGAGPLDQIYKQRVRDLGLSENVRFLGMVPQSQLPQLYRRATMAVFPFIVAKTGDQEGLGLVSIEAMGCGCPVIASDLPGVREAVINEFTGILTEPNDPDALTHSIKKLLSDPVKREKLSKNARKYVYQKFDWEIVRHNYSSLYKNLLTKN